MEFDLVLYGEMKKHLSEVLYFTQECIVDEVDDIQEDIFDLIKFIEVNSEKKDYFLEKNIEKLIANEAFAEQKFRQVNFRKSFSRCYNGLKSYSNFIDKKAENEKYANACKHVLMDFQRDIKIGYKNLTSIEQFLEEPLSIKSDTINLYLKNIETYLNGIEHFLQTWCIDSEKLNNPYVIRKYSDFMNNAFGEIRNNLAAGGNIKQNLCNIDLLFQKIIDLDEELKVKEIKVTSYDNGAIMANDIIKVNGCGELELSYSDDNGEVYFKYYSIWEAFNKIFQNILKFQDEWDYMKLINDEMGFITIGVTVSANGLMLCVYRESFVVYYKTIIERLLKLIENKKIDFKRVKDLFDVYPIQYDKEWYQNNFVYIP